MRFHVVSLCGDLGAPALASVMMQKVRPWPPIWVAVGIVVTTTVAIIFVLETLKHQPDREDVDEVEVDTPNLESRISHVISRFKDSLSTFSSLISLVLLLLTSLRARLVMSTLQFMAQFISKRYDIELAKTGYVQSTFGITQVLHALVILPWLARFLLRYDASEVPRER
ncbi:hypothetical protein F4818DRAFT_73333 [Hypoxylon cercidicola]|nr:hypothetical protein F4818DRAFT_73333 [Hypoxylon cercidicola]